MPAYQTGLRCFACIPLHSCGFCPIPQKYPSKAFPGEHLESVMETGNSGCCYSRLRFCVRAMGGGIARRHQCVGRDTFCLADE